MCQIQYGPNERGDPRHVEEHVAQTGCQRSQSGPQIDETERVGMDWSPVVRVVVRKKFRAVRRNVHIGRAFCLARFARQAEVERLFDRLAVPACANDFALKKFKERMSTASRAVRLLECNHVAWTHRAGIVLAALSKTDAS